MMINPKTIHETELVEILGKIVDGADKISDAMSKSGSTDISKSYSLARATSALTLVFPTLVSGSLSPDAASMISKAIERKCVSMMQIALSAFNFSNSATNAVDFIKDFHTNVNMKKMDLDEFIGIADQIASNNVKLESFNYGAMAAIKEDNLRNINYYFDDTINERSLSDFSFKRNGLRDVVTEAKGGKGGKGKPSNGSDNGGYYSQKGGIADNIGPDEEKGFKRKAPVDNRELPDSPENMRKMNKREAEMFQKAQANYLKQQEIEQRKENEERKYQMDKDKFEYQKMKDAEKSEYDKERDKARQDMDMRNANMNYFRNQIVSSDVKKANELVPSMMIVNFMYEAPNKEIISQQAMIGIKSKMYVIDPNEMVTRIVTKHVDSNTLLKLVKVGTREISFFRDFLLAIDNAKIEALSKSKRGSSSKLFKVIERRALGGKVRKIMGRPNNCKPIFSLVISREEADYMLNYNDIDVDNPSVVIPIMEKLNLMYFIIVDESTETAKFLLDGDTVYETLSFSSLEKEVSDGGYKKVVNLISKMNR